MEKAEIKSIADYLKDLEEGLYEWDYRGITTQGALDQTLRHYRATDAGNFRDQRPGA